jgi:hypothetical protein
MLNRPYKQIEQFAYSNFTETCCPGLRLASGCLTLSCDCRLMDPQYHLLPAVSAFIWCVRQATYFTSIICQAS